MSNIAVRVEGLGKIYRIGGKQERYRTLRDTLTDAFAAPFRRANSLLHGQAYGAANLNETIWALKDVSFEVRHGEVVGIIGRNGAGKSTLLKILSRITEPTEGYADVYGRVGSLLEVGTGFHPELTGRENIYLNGAILGMSREEIDRKFDEIVAFAEIERFIDTPVKHYSSGMGLRLGFAVAAHLEPEILVVDEVLAVGDAQFQKKCLGKMSEVAGEGRTVLFVSHNMVAVLGLCSRALCYRNGLLVDDGDVHNTVQRYISHERLADNQDLRNHKGRRTKHGALLKRIVLGYGGVATTTFVTNEAFAFSVECEADLSEMQTLSLGFLLSDPLGGPIFGANMKQYSMMVPNPGIPVTINVCIEHLMLSPGTYSLSLFLGNGVHDLDIIENAVNFTVFWKSQHDLPAAPRPSWGWAYLPVTWQVSGRESNHGRLIS